MIFGSLNSFTRFKIFFFNNLINMNIGQNNKIDQFISDFLFTFIHRIE